MTIRHALTAAAGNTSPAVPTDPQFNYVSLLLHGDGTNGAQNNTFVDSSTNNFTITRNGNTTQGSLSPYGNLWSNYFDGSGDRLSFPAGSSTAFGTSDFTVEGWINSSNASATFFYIIDNRNASQTNNWAFFVDNSSYLQWYNGSSSLIISTGPTVVRGQWHHFAYSRSGSTGRLFLNGTLLGGWTDNTNYSTSPTTAYIASRYSNTENLMGSLSNIRIVKGTALYTSNFTPSTTPLTAVSGTSLLTCQSNRFIDNSANNFTITRTGDVRVTKESPFLPTAAYSTSTIGGSGYFDGTGDYLTVGGGMPSGQGTEFTLEFWAYAIGVKEHVFTQGPSGGTLDFYVNSSGAVKLDNTGVAAIASSANNTFPYNVWTHIALTRTTGNVYTIYINGVSVATGTNSTSMTANTTIGQHRFTGSSYFLGYMSNWRVTNTRVYTANFTPPSAPLTAISGTSLLLNFTNAGIFDNAAENDMETVGNAQISTSVKKYGTGSLAFDGTGDWLLVPDNTNLQLGSGSFTVEGWVNLAFLGSARGLASKGTSTTGWSLSVNSLNQVVFTDATTAITTTTALMANTWYHVAVVRSGTGTNQTVIYIDGVSSATGTSASNFNQTSVMYVGADRTGGSALNGYIDDLRITKGYARYTANFTPPTAAFPDQ